MWTGFKKESFELLKKYEEDNDANNYKREEFDPLIRDQFKELKDSIFSLVSSLLPEYRLTDNQALSKHSTRSNTLYHHFWGAIYRESKEKKTKDMQLFWRIDTNRFSFGMYVGHEADQALLDEIQENINKNHTEILTIFKSIIHPRPLVCKKDDAHGFGIEEIRPEVAFAKDVLREKAGINIYFDYSAEETTTLGAGLRDEVLLGFQELSKLYKLIVTPVVQSAAAVNSPKTKIVEKNMGADVSKSKNIIYYGPPGTGKTWTIRELQREFESNAPAGNKDHHLNEIAKTLSWWECMAFALATLGKWSKVADIKAHPVVQAKINIQNSQSINNTLWAQLQNHTILESVNVNTRVDKRFEPLIFEKDKQSQWNLVPNWKELIPEIDEAVSKYQKGAHLPPVEKRYRFVTFHPGYTYEDFILGIRPDTDEIDGISYKKVPGKFKEICDEARKNPKQEYAIFIDEINRGNIPAIFGELITLIEDDKRDWEVDILGTTDKFSVPENLWIYGTMNTADRSVESLDIALRRRFMFKSLYPDPTKLNKKIVEGVNLEILLETINKRIEFLKDKDHTIGHSYFMKIDSLADLRICFKNKIIPLLEEYFYNDMEKIGLILGNGFVKKNESFKNIEKLFANFDSDIKDELSGIQKYYIEDAENLEAKSFSDIYGKK